MTCFAVVAGGGTSGHVLPALAIAEALVDAGHAVSDVVYFGALRGVETSLVPPTGFPHEFFDVVGLKREVSATALRNNATFIPRMLRARRRAVAYMREHRPRVVISVGGYASLPAVLAARVCRIPVVVVSYDRRPGRSSEWAARYARRCAVAYPDSTLPRAAWTGAPVRRSIRLLDRSTERSAARQRWGIPDDVFLVGVIGGSLGSGILNDAIRAYAHDHAADGGIAIHHVVGQRFYDADVEPMTREEGGLDYEVVAYEEDMVTMYSAVDLLVGRGGAGTVAEVATVGVPSILIPWSGAADDHQTENVRWLSDNGGAVLLREGDVEARLGDTIDELRANPERLGAVARAAWSMGERNRMGSFAELIDEVVVEERST
jgi:UDP-N-acetylglucosamine--N-acetylmuramyl-(pentapeptide) pyrophosphoryl-undecaprenol N-acetylglucosamine transferase